MGQAWAAWYRLVGLVTASSIAACGDAKAIAFVGVAFQAMGSPLEDHGVIHDAHRTRRLTPEFGEGYEDALNLLIEGW